MGSSIVEVALPAELGFEVLRKAREPFRGAAKCRRETT